MYTVFSINIPDKLTLSQKFKSFFSIPIIELSYLYENSTRFCVASLTLKKDSDNRTEQKIIRAAFAKLFKSGVRSILLPPFIDKKDAQAAGLIPYSPDNSLFFHSAPKILSILFGKLKEEAKDIWCVFYSAHIGKVFEKSVLSSVQTVRYISIDCGEFSDILSGTLLKEYGVSAPGHKDNSCKKVLALFSHINKKKLWDFEPDVIIDFFGQNIEYDNALIVRGAEFSLPAQFTDGLPEDINMSAFFSLLFESGHADIEQFEILRLM